MTVPKTCASCARVRSPHRERASRPLLSPARAIREHPKAWGCVCACFRKKRRRGACDADGLDGLGGFGKVDQFEFGDGPLEQGLAVGVLLGQDLVLGLIDRLVRDLLQQSLGLLRFEHLRKATSRRPAD